MNIELEAIRMRHLWKTLFREFGCDTPSLTQFYVWLSKFPPSVIERAITATMRKAFFMSKNNESMSYAYQVNYAEKVMLNLTQDQVNAELREFGIAPDPPVAAQSSTKVSPPPTNTSVNSLEVPRPVAAQSGHRREKTDQEMMDMLNKIGNRNKLIRESEERAREMVRKVGKL